MSGFYGINTDKYFKPKADDTEQENRIYAVKQHSYYDSELDVVMDLLVEEDIDDDHYQ